MCLRLFRPNLRTYRTVVAGVNGLSTAVLSIYGATFNIWHRASKDNWPALPATSLHVPLITSSAIHLPPLHLSVVFRSAGGGVLQPDGVAGGFDGCRWKAGDLGWLVLLRGSAAFSVFGRRLDGPGFSGFWLGRMGGGSGGVAGFDGRASVGGWCDAASFGVFGPCRIRVSPL
ncbi:hypothetical protein QQ045_022495 [Rhodiola kirilowii]